MQYGTPGMPLVGAGDYQPVPFEQPKNLFRYGEQALWSSYLWVGGTVVAGGTYRFFATQIGRTGQGFVNPMTIAETNIKLPGRVPTGVGYDVYGIASSFYKADGTADGGDITTAVNTAGEVDELINFQYNLCWSWDFTQTVIDIASMDLVGAGGGAFGAIGTTVNNSSQGAMANGPGSIWLYRKHPVALPGASTFALQAKFGSRAAAVGTNSTVVRATLFGYYKNVIEIG